MPYETLCEMSFSCKKMVVVGIGLIGASLIKALKRANCPMAEIVAVGRNQAILQRAQNQGLIDRYYLDVAGAVAGADIVILATPVGAMAGLFESMRSNLPDNCIITDVGSVKSYVSNVALDALAEKAANFVPAHPISGTEHSGLDASFEQLFDGRNTVLTPLSINSPEYIERIRQMWLAAGSVVLEMTPIAHDRIFAATSHLPHVLVYTLMNTISDFDDADEFFQVVAGGFMDYTRIASSDAIMWRDVCLTNKKPILKMISKYKSKLEKIEKMIENEQGAALFAQFQKAKDARDKLVLERKRHKKGSL